MVNLRFARFSSGGDSQHQRDALTDDHLTRKLGGNDPMLSLASMPYKRELTIAAAVLTVGIGGCDGWLLPPHIREPDSDAHFDAEADADGDYDRDSGADADSDLDGDISPDADSDVDHGQDGEGYPDGDADLDFDHDGDVNADGDADIDSDGDADLDFDHDGEGDRDTDGDHDLPPVCIETDDGMDVWTPGAATVGTDTTEDRCDDDTVAGSILYEAYCDGATVRIETVHCSDVVDMYCVDAACMPPVCSDPDGSDTSTARTTLMSVGRFTLETHEDICSITGDVLEGTCDDDGTIVVFEIPCDEGDHCVEGACVPFMPFCIETDGGSDPETAGSATDLSGTYGDSCVDTDVLTEMVCADDIVEETEIDCTDFSQFCVHDACHTPICAEADGTVTVTADGVEIDSETDRCEGDTMVDASCRGASIVLTRFHCSSVGQYCVDGSCIPPVCVDDGHTVTVTLGGEVFEEDSDHCEGDSVVDVSCNADGSIQRTRSACDPLIETCRDAACAWRCAILYEDRIRGCATSGRSETVFTMSVDGASNCHATTQLSVDVHGLYVDESCVEGPITNLTGYAPDELTYLVFSVFCNPTCGAAALCYENFNVPITFSDPWIRADTGNSGVYVLDIGGGGRHARFTMDLGTIVGGYLRGTFQLTHGLP